MKIIIELTLLVSFSCTFYVLSLTSKLTKEPLRLGLLGGTLASIVSLIYPLWNVEKWALGVLFLGTISCINLLCFKYVNFKRYLERLALMAMLTFLLGGCCLAIENFFGQISLFVVAVVTAITFALTKAVIRFRERQNAIEKFTYSVVLKDKGEKFSLSGFLDSGNMLYDTITKKPIMLVDYEVFHKLYSDIPYFKVLTKTFDERKVKNGHYIKVNSLSAGASIFVFSVEEALVGENRRVKEPMLGLSLSGFEKSFGRNILLHSELV